VQLKPATHMQAANLSEMIAGLPEALQLRVFELLDEASLEQARLVCTRSRWPGSEQTTKPYSQTQML